jgi:hypothetical protein
MDTYLSHYLTFEEPVELRENRVGKIFRLKILLLLKKINRLPHLELMGIYSFDYKGNKIFIIEPIPRRKPIKKVYNYKGKEIACPDFETYAHNKKLIWEN